MSNKILFPQIYLSYSWKNNTIAYAIEEDFNAIGIRLIRDVRNLSYSKPFKKFAGGIGLKDYIWLIISEETFLCENLMFDLTEMLKENIFNNRILLIRAITIDDTDKENKIEKVKTFWKEKLEDAEEKCTHELSTTNIDLFIKYQTIINEIDQLILKLYEPPYLDIETLKDEYYKPLLETIEIEDKELISKALVISSISNKKEKEEEIEKFLTLYPNNKYGLYLNAFMEMKNGVFWKAKNFFQQLVDYNKNDLLANLHLATIYTEHYLAYKLARKILFRMQNRYPLEPAVFFKLGIISEKHFSKNSLAKQYFEKAIEIDPNHTASLYCLGLMEETLFNNLDEAKLFYEKAIASNTTHIDSLFRLGYVLKEHFVQYRRAYDLLVRVIKLQPKHADAHYHLAVLYNHHFGVFSKAKKHYFITVSLNPDNVDALYQLANLLTNHYHDYKKGRLFLEKILSINPKKLEAHYSLAKLLTYEFHEQVSARLHYDLAVKKDDRFIDNDLDKKFGICRRAKRKIREQ